MLVYSGYCLPRIPFSMQWFAIQVTLVQQQDKQEVQLHRKRSVPLGASLTHFFPFFPGQEMYSHRHTQLQGNYNSMTE